MAMNGKTKELDSKSLMLVMNIKKFVVFLLICLVPMNDEIRSTLKAVIATAKTRADFVIQ